MPHDSLRRAVMSRDPFLAAALTAAARGWAVFPLVPGEKIPAIRDWEQRATTDQQQIHRWWARGARNNIAVSTGRSGLVVIDLDGARGDIAPERFAGARNGYDALAMLAAEAGAEMPTNTFTVATPGGRHLYFRAPSNVPLRNSAGAVAWKVDVRAKGGYILAAGSVRDQGIYQVERQVPVAELPAWLARALAPRPAPTPGNPLQLPRGRSTAYVRAIVEREARLVVTARTGTRHSTLLKAARTLGRLVGGEELVESDARTALHTAAAGHIGIDGTTPAEVHQTIEDGLRYGIQLPRRVTGSPVRTSSSNRWARPSPGRDHR